MGAGNLFLPFRQVFTDRIPGSVQPLRTTEITRRFLGYQGNPVCETCHEAQRESGFNIRDEGQGGDIAASEGDGRSYKATGEEQGLGLELGQEFTCRPKTAPNLE